MRMEVPVPREEQDDAPSLLELLSDWYWEQDEEFRFTAVAAHRGGNADAFARAGQRHWEIPALNLTDADWERHRAQLTWHQPFRDFEVQRQSEDGRLQWIAISGQPRMDAAGVFRGYRGIARDITLQKRAEQLRKLEQAVARTLAQASRLSEGLRAALRLVCEYEGWDSGRCFRTDEATGEVRFEEAWFAREAAIEHMLKGSRVLWEAGKPVWSTDLPRTPGMPARPATRAGAFATFAFPVISQGKTLAMLAFSGHTSPEPDQSFIEAAPAVGSLFGQFLQRQASELQLRESEARFRSLTHLSSDFFWESDAQHRLTTLVYGPTYAESRVARGAIGRAPWDIPSVSPDQSGWTGQKAAMNQHLPFRDFEFTRTDPDGTRRHYALSGEPRFAHDGDFVGYRGVGRDITEIVLARERIAALAYSDPLTGLANRVSLVPALEQATERARRHGSKVAGIFVDLDGFKQVNDLHGHAAGDSALVQVARRLRRCLRASDLIARLGGDEFFVVLEDVQEVGAVERVVNKLVAELLRAYDLGSGVTARFSASIGISLFPDDAEDGTVLIEHADKAMYSAKKAGKNAYCLYTTAVGGGQPMTPHAVQPGG